LRSKLKLKVIIKKPHTIILRTFKQTHSKTAFITNCNFAVILLSLFPHYCDDLLSCHPMTRVPTGRVSSAILVISWRHSSDLVHRHRKHSGTHFSPALKLSGLLGIALRTGWKNTQGLGEGSVSVFLCSIDTTSRYLLLPHLMARLPSPKVQCPCAALCTHINSEISPWGDLCFRKKDK